MKPLLLDRIALLAMVLYIMGALSYYLPFFLGSGAYTAPGITSFFLLPPVFAGAGAYALVRYRNEWDFAPRWLAVAALGSGAVTLLAWELLHFAMIQYNRAHPQSDFSGPDVDPSIRFVLPYMLLCGLLSIAAACALPKLVTTLFGAIRRPAPIITALALLALAGCAPRSEPAARAPLTERQRDSILARSGLPGATVVGRALEVSDQAVDRAAETAAADSLFR